MTTPLPAAEHRGRRGHPVTAGALCLLACLGILVTTLVTWVHEVVLQTDAWVGLMTRVLADRDVIDQISRVAVLTAADALDIEAHLVAILPQDSTLARPLVVALEQTLTDQVANALAGAEFQHIWADANRLVHQEALRLLHGGTEELAVDDGLVTLNLFPLIDDVLRELQVSGYIASDVVLPDLRAPDAPEVLRHELGSALGIDLPADYGTLRLLRSVELGALQETVELVDALAVACWVVTLLLVAAALWLATDRRRMVVGLAFGAVGGLALARVVLGAWADGVDPAFEDRTVGPLAGALVGALVDDLFAVMLAVAAVAFAVGCVAAIAGPLREHRATAGGPRSLREAVRSGVREHAPALRWAGVAIVAFAVVWRVAGPDVASLAAIAVVAWFAVLRWLAGSTGRRESRPPPPSLSPPSSRPAVDR